MKYHKYVNLEDLLVLIPTDDLVGPKPSYLRQKINKLPTITLMELDPDEYERYINNDNCTE